MNDLVRIFENENLLVNYVKSFKKRRRKCWNCNKRLYFTDFLLFNLNPLPEKEVKENSLQLNKGIKKQIKELLINWNNPYYYIYCCSCLNLLEECYDQIIQTDLWKKELKFKTIFQEIEKEVEL